MGDAVNQSVVITFMLLFAVNMVLTAIYLQIVPPKGAERCPCSAGSTAPVSNSPST